MPKCPLCPAEVQNIRQHLRVVHKVLNVQERDILIKFARSRVKLENLECPLCHTLFKYVEKHLIKGHRDTTVSYL